jgi:hypothetical protein
VGGACGARWEERKVYKVLVGKTKERRSVGRPRSRWEFANKMDVRDIAFGGGGGGVVSLNCDTRLTKANIRLYFLRPEF